jgi:hypothetical protein
MVAASDGALRMVVDGRGELEVNSSSRGKYKTIAADISMVPTNTRKKGRETGDRTDGRRQELELFLSGYVWVRTRSRWESAGPRSTRHSLLVSRDKENGIFIKDNVGSE